MDNELRTLAAKCLLTLRLAEVESDPESGLHDPRPELEAEAERLGVDVGSSFYDCEVRNASREGG